jgi:acetoin utilization protein AcuB
MPMPAISRFMTRQPWTIDRQARLSEATAIMGEHQIRHLPVLDAGKLVGIVSERDVYRLERLRHLCDHFAVEDAMTEDVYAAALDEPLDTVVEAMAQHKYGSAIVMNRDDSVEGIFTTVDGMEVLADTLRHTTA